MNNKGRPTYMRVEQFLGNRTLCSTQLKMTRSGKISSILTELIDTKSWTHTDIVPASDSVSMIQQHERCGVPLKVATDKALVIQGGKEMTSLRSSSAKDSCFSTNAETVSFVRGNSSQRNSEEDQRT